MNREDILGVPEVERVPRMRGDEPLFSCGPNSPCAEFPACAGMNRRKASVEFEWI